MQKLTHTFELSQAKINLRSDLKFSLQANDASSYYVVEDDANGNFFRIGVTEYTFLSLLDGKRTIEEASSKLSTLEVGGSLNEQEVYSLARWIVDAGLAKTASSISAERVQSERQRKVFQESLSWLNPISFKIPLFNPEELLKKVYSVSRPMFGPMFLAVWLLVVSIGAMTAWFSWDEFWNNHIQAFSSIDFLWVGITWLLLKVVHESAHAVLCKHYGGRVPSSGILLLLFIPLPYVDVSSSWHFRSAFQRIMVSAAGMMAELMIASVSIIAWINCEPGPLRFHLSNLIIAATLHTLLFNINPLMRFDGYYMLVDAIGIPNLYTRGRSRVKSFAKWLFFGIKFSHRSEPSKKQFFIVSTYGVLSLLWMVLICVSISVAAIGIANGIGAIVAMFGILLWVGIPAYMLLKFLLKKHETVRLNMLRFAMVSSICVAGLIIFLTLFPAPPTITAPVVIQYKEVDVVRAKVPGFVSEIHAKFGEHIEKDQLLLRMVNPEMAARLKKTTIDLESSRLRAKAHKSNQDIAAWKIEREEFAALQKQKIELEEQVKSLQVRAKCDGTILSSKLDEIGTTYISSGEEILSIAPNFKKIALAMVQQEDVAELRKNSASDNVTIRVWGLGVVQGTILKIAPRATDHLPHFSFASNLGGPLTVVSRKNTADDAKPRLTRSLSEQARELNSASNQFALNSLKSVDQYVPVEISLDASSADQLACGQGGQMEFSGRRSSLGNFLYQHSIRWFSDRIQLNHGL